MTVQVGRQTFGDGMLMFPSSMEKIMPDSVSPSLQGTEVNPSRKLSLSEDIRQKLLNANRFILTVGVGAIIILLFMLLPVKQSIVGLLEAVQAMGDFAPLVFIGLDTQFVFFSLLTANIQRRTLYALLYASLVL